MKRDYEELTAESLGNAQFHLLWVLHHVNVALLIFVLPAVLCLKGKMVLARKFTTVTFFIYCEWVIATIKNF